MLYQFVVDQDCAGKRLDLVIKNKIPDISRARARKAIESGFCELDGIQNLSPDQKVRICQNISINIPDERTSAFAEEGDLSIVWCDRDLAVCDKPPDLAVHPCPSCPEHTLVNRLLAHFPQLENFSGERPGIVHRLDKDTSGLMLIALNEETRIALNEAFAERRIAKRYLALVSGKPPEYGECDKAIGRDPVSRVKMAIVDEKRGGKRALTEWKRLWHSTNENISLLSVRIHTGRTHQIRVHLASQGHPVLGDALYGNKSVQSLAPRQMLHACELNFVHPRNNEPMDFYQAPPKDFMNVLRDNIHELTRIVITGNQGCGKTSFCAALSEIGLPVISADAIVADLYDKNGAAVQWLEMRFPENPPLVDGKVEKNQLFNIFNNDQQIRKEFTDYIHELVKTRIETFWHECECKREVAAIAEIPLFFECGWHKIWQPQPHVIGIRCGKENRWRRIKENRNWPMEKIEILERWQMPEDKKMAACDFVVDNNGEASELKNAAKKFYASLLQKKIQENNELLEYLEKKCMENEP